MPSPDPTGEVTNEAGVCTNTRTRGEVPVPVVVTTGTDILQLPGLTTVGPLPTEMGRVTVLHREYVLPTSTVPPSTETGSGPSTV